MLITCSILLLGDGGGGGGGVLTQFNPTVDDDDAAADAIKLDAAVDKNVDALLLLFAQFELLLQNVVDKLDNGVL